MDSWYSGTNLYEAKEFSFDDYRNRFQQKRSWISHSTDVGSNNGPTKYVKPLKANLHLNPEMKFPHIPQIKWDCPPKFSVDHEWKVVSGEESEERVTQKHRETKVVEAVYPHFSAIPPSPFEPLDVGIVNLDDDSTIPVIPIIAIEEAAEPSINIVAAGAPNTFVDLQPPDLPQCSSTPGIINAPQIPSLGLLAASGGDLAADAASVALTALVKTQEMGNLIDKDLLIQILSNPQLIKKLTDKTGCDSLSVPKPVTGSLPLVGPRHEMVKKSMNDHRELGVPSNSGIKPICESGKIVTQPVTYPSSIPNVINILTNENRIPVSPASSVAGRGSKPVDMMNKKWINENCTAQTAGSKTVTSSVSLPNSKPDLVTIKRLINEYGQSDKTGKKSTVVPANLGNNVRSPSRGDTHTMSFSSQVVSHPSLKDINYFKSLIKEHGKRQELPVSEPVMNVKSSELEAKYEKHCIYFNSPLGCRRGSGCLFKHVVSDQPMMAGRGSGRTGAKRLRL